jgi:hypothetical protein
MSIVVSTDGLADGCRSILPPAIWRTPKPTTVAAIKILALSDIEDLDRWTRRAEITFDG